ncbi:MAG: hypothetical protein AAGI66_09320 [Cyanobacteria bacterium P01_H01_bin.74]
MTFFIGNGFVNEPFLLFYTILKHPIAENHALKPTIKEGPSFNSQTRYYFGFLGCKNSIDIIFFYSIVNTTQLKQVAEVVEW